MQDPNAASRMHEIDDTLEKLVKVAKKKGYLDPEASVESLKEEARSRAASDRAAKSDRDESSAGLMEAMRKRLDSQTAAVCLSGCAQGPAGLWLAGWRLRRQGISVRSLPHAHMLPRMMSCSRRHMRTLVHRCRCQSCAQLGSAGSEQGACLRPVRPSSPGPSV